MVLDGALVVLDGATSWLPQDPDRDGGWYARTLGRALTGRLPGHGTSLAGHLAAAIGQVRDEFDLDPVETSYSTATVVRWDEQTVEALVLGDSPVLVHHRAGPPELVADDRLEPVAAALRARHRQHLRDGHGFDERFAALIARLQTAEREHRNRPGGYWVAAAAPEAAYRAVRRSWPASTVSAVLAMTDGLAAGVLEYDLFDWAEMAARVRESGPASVVAAVHDAELTDPDGRRWPRTKRHDDKSLAALLR